MVLRLNHCILFCFLMLNQWPHLPASLTNYCVVRVKLPDRMLQHGKPFSSLFFKNILLYTLRLVLVVVFILTSTTTATVVIMALAINGPPLTKRPMSVGSIRQKPGRRLFISKAFILSMKRTTAANEGGTSRNTVAPQVLNSRSFDNNDRDTRPTPIGPSAGRMMEAGTLGDIMSSGLLTDTSPLSQDNILVSSLETGSLASKYGISNPMDRMALTANGNLQRLVSSYYDAPVLVLVDSCSLRTSNNLPIKSYTNTTIATTTTTRSNIDGSPPADKNGLNVKDQQQQTWDRIVHLTVFNTTFCTAISEITVYDKLCQQLVASNEVGLGQLFRFLNILPTFSLLDAGPKPNGGFWRLYTLQCNELECRIHEDFCHGMWDLLPQPVTTECTIQPPSSRR